jgi:hypothetical protein
MKRSKEYDDLCRSAGVALDNPGLSEVGLKRADALHAVDILRNAGLAILGGDVYLRREGRVTPSDANSWYVNPNPREDAHAYLRRSWERAESYIGMFPESLNGEPLFVIVTGDVPGTSGF